MHFWQNDMDPLRASVVTGGGGGGGEGAGNRYRNGSAQKVHPVQENYSALLPGTRSRDLSIRSPRSTTTLSPLPKF